MDICALCNELRVAAARRVRHFAVPYTNLSYDILVQLYRRGFVSHVSLGSTKGPYAKGDGRTLWVEMKYYKGIPGFEDVRVISKPSLPVYSTAEGLFEALCGNNRRIASFNRPGRCIFIRTKYGIKELGTCVYENIGGECLFEIS